MAECAPKLQKCVFWNILCRMSHSTDLEPHASPGLSECERRNFETKQDGGLVFFRFRSRCSRRHSPRLWLLLQCHFVTGGHCDSRRAPLQPDTGGAESGLGCRDLLPVLPRTTLTTAAAASAAAAPPPRRRRLLLQLLQLVQRLNKTLHYYYYYFHYFHYCCYYDYDDY